MGKNFLSLFLSPFLQQKKEEQSPLLTWEPVHAHDVPSLERRDRGREPLDPAPEVASVGHHLHLDSVGFQVEEHELPLCPLGVDPTGKRRRLFDFLLPGLESGLVLVDVLRQRQRRRVLVRVRVLARGAHGGDGADAGLVELGRVGVVVVIVVVDQGRSRGGVLRLNSGWRGVGLLKEGGVRERR